MIWAALVGAVMGSGGSAVGVGLLVVWSLVGANGIIDVSWHKSLMTGEESNYQAYLRNLETDGVRTGHPWASYLLQHIVFGGAVGSVVFLVTRALFG